MSAIQELNDSFRAEGPRIGLNWLMTAGVQNEGGEFIAAAISAVRSYTSFTSDNDPYGERDFGSFLINGCKLFWKIDYYDLSLQYGAEDPANPKLTRRVMTIMLASEY